MIIKHDSPDSSSKENDIEQDQRRIDLLNDPNYGIILCFLDKYRTILDLPHYPLQLFEDHLLQNHEQNPTRLIDFHFILLKRLSLAKNAQRDRFDSIITKFVSRYDQMDSEQLMTVGYLQANISLKVRIIKNLFESQFDLNQTLKNTLIEQSSSEIRSLPFGRDRFGAFYWFFMDKDGFIRLFRENVNDDRTWTNIAKNRDELEKFLQLLITDTIVRKKFPDWIIDYEPFVTLLPTNEFEQYYSSIQENVGSEEIETTPTTDEEKKTIKRTKRKRGRAKRFTKPRNRKSSIEVKNENEKFDVNMESEGEERKRQSTLNESQCDETSLDDMSLALRRSSRSRKTLTTKPILVVSSKNISPLPDKIPKTSNARRRPKRKTRRNMDDYFCMSTSSSEEQIDDLSEEDDDNDDDYIDPIETDDHFFDLDQDDNISNETQLRTAKTAQTSTIITTCFVCTKSDRPEVLLLCDDCNDAYHLDCLFPILLSVPDGDWYCPLCEHKQLSNSLIMKLKELVINLNSSEIKQRIRLSKKHSQRKIKIKDYSSDESITASESDNNEDSMLSTTSQINENSNLSSSYFDDEKSNISQRGRYRRTRFDIKKMLENDFDDDIEKTDFTLQIPKKITRLLHRHERSTHKNDSQLRTMPTRLYDQSFDLNEKLGSPLVYVNGDGNARQTKSVVTNSKQTSKIVRRWNDVRRRSRLKAIHTKLSNETVTSDYMDENSGGFGQDDISLPYSNDSNSNSGIRDDDIGISRTKINLIQPTTLGTIDTCITRNHIRKSDVNFDRLTRDIQNAVNEAHSLPNNTILVTPITNQQQMKRTQKIKFSPYISKTPTHLPEIPDNVHDIFKSNDSLLSHSIHLLTPSSSLPNTSDHQPTSYDNS
ncbi:hypothetical protein I4U23_002254 [Adineta vaga]|nr:hypothetical protein I4U23_002254 [Adineta vaga]